MCEFVENVNGKEYGFDLKKLAGAFRINTERKKKVDGGGGGGGGERGRLVTRVKRVTRARRKSVKMQLKQAKKRRATIIQWEVKQAFGAF